MTTSITTTPTTPADVADALFPDLQLASLQFQAAKAAFKHSPNGDTQFGLEKATERVNALLDTLLDWR